MNAVTKETNPKDAIGVTKLPLHLIPGTAKAFLAIAFLEGALKYGKYNWRVAGVRASIYIDAMERHMEKWKDGEETDPLTGVPHLASVMACSAIILDARACGALTDDRPPKAPTAETIDALAPLVRYLQQLYKDESPHQNTIEDSTWVSEKEATHTTKNIMEPLKRKSRERRATRQGAKRKKKARSKKATVKK